MRKAGATRGNTWLAIRKAAIELLYTHGFSVMNLRQLSSAVGLQAGSLYNYFDSKDDLLFRLITEIMQEMLDQIDLELADVHEPVARMTKLIEILVNWHTKRRMETYIGHMEMRSLPDDRFKAYVAQRDRFEAIFMDIVRQGSKAKVFEVANEKIVTVSVLAMLTGISTWYRPDGKLSVGQLVVIYQGMVLKLLGTSKQPP